MAADQERLSTKRVSMLPQSRRAELRFCVPSYAPDDDVVDGNAVPACVSAGASARGVSVRAHKMSFTKKPTKPMMTKPKPVRSATLWNSETGARARKEGGTATHAPTMLSARRDAGRPCRPAAHYDCTGTAARGGPGGGSRRQLRETAAQEAAQQEDNACLPQAQHPASSAALSYWQERLTFPVRLGAALHQPDAVLCELLQRLKAHVVKHVHGAVRYLLTATSTARAALCVV